jgi:hypothetical protein
MLPLDVVLEYVSDSIPLPDPVEFKMDPPAIFISQSPAILVNIDGKPLFGEIKETELEYVLNTNWDILKLKERDRLFLRNENQWLTATSIDGDWVKATVIPQAFSQLPEDENWKSVKDTLDQHAAGLAKEVPKVFVSQKPAELILIQGSVKLDPVGRGSLSIVANTSSDLFYHGSENKYYYLVSGRWFSTPSLNNAVWTHTSDLPEEFQDIPEDHPAATVRANVPGTKEAQKAVLETQIPQTAVVDREMAEVDVFYAGEPEFRPTGVAGVTYAVNTSFSVIKVEDKYYVCHDAVWFVSDKPEGPWEVATNVPDSVYTIPPDIPVYNVTQVKVYDYSPVYVTFGFTYGYYGCYPYYGSVIWGTGWYYDPWYYYPPYGYPYYYYPYPYTYGCAAWYNSNTGMYGRAGFAYGPYGGVGRGAAYNPETGTFARGRAAWGPYNGVASGWAYSPRTGIAAATRQNYDAYSAWGESVLRRDDNWLHTKSYRDARGAIMGYESSRGGQGVIIGDGDNRTAIGRGGDGGNTFVGRNGNVFRKDENGWSRHENGDWTPITMPDNLQGRIDGIDREQLNSQLQVSREQLSQNLSNRGFTAEDIKSARNNSWNSRNYTEVIQLERDWNARSRGNQQFQNYQRNYSGGSFGGGGRSGGFGNRSFRR